MLAEIGAGRCTTSQPDLLSAQRTISVDAGLTATLAAERLHCVADCELMQDKPPRPEDDSIGIVEAPRTVAYVASFGGFAVETSILTQARALREKLREDGQRFDVRALICTNVT